MIMETIEVKVEPVEITGINEHLCDFVEDAYSGHGHEQKEESLHEKHLNTNTIYIFSYDASIIDTIDGDITVDVTIKKKLGWIWVKVPCIAQAGSW